MTVEALRRDQSNQPLIAKQDISFSVEELEWLCQLEYDPGKNPTPERQKASELAKKEKMALALKLAQIFEEGSEEAARDPWKAYDLRKKAGQNPEPPGNNFFRTDTFYRYHAWWFTGIRLLLVRINRFFVALSKTFLPAFFSYFGLSYGIGFALDLFIVLKTTFSPKLTPYEKEHPMGFLKRTWTRFKNIIQKDNRPYRMMNDFVWFTVNVIVLCTAGPLYLLLNPILNLIGFGFDTAHEFFWFGRDTQKYTRLTNKFTKQIQNLKEDLNTNLHPGENQALKDQINILELMKDSIKAKRKEIFRRRLWITCWTAVVLVGMALLYFPPTALPGAFLIGSGLALIGGSVFTGLGRRLYLIAEDFVGKIKKWYKKNHPASDISLSTVNIGKGFRVSSDSAATKPQTPDTASDNRSEDIERPTLPPRAESNIVLLSDNVLPKIKRSPSDPGIFSGKKLVSNNGAAKEQLIYQHK